ncbi:MAG TPA: DNA-3-methyladenine glycosylase [Candidatus Acidoferrales bacterium]|nr:DNA-3-methyladenine glycosylase [Candidatus Acidoferrales bacterium]
MSDVLRRLAREELPSQTVALARFLIGKYIVHDLPEGRTAGRIVETEAYVPGDASGHAYRGQTARNRSLFLERGHAYVYFTYGMWHCLNVTSETPGVGAGVLLRAIEPVEGIALMERRRSTTRPYDLGRGPGRLVQALGVGRADDGVDLCGAGNLWLAHGARSAAEIGESVRIGITRETAAVLRFYERGSPFVSGPRHLRA